MQSITWKSFGIATATTRTLVHFFPSAGNVSAPYPVMCRFQIKRRIRFDLLIDSPPYPHKKNCFSWQEKEL